MSPYFLGPLRTESLLRAIGLGWDLVPVVIQDPIWEESFPDLAGIGVHAAFLAWADQRRSMGWGR